MDLVELAPTLRPLLALGERIICVQNKVGLYKGAERDEEHDNGTVYLTSHRIVYVDQLFPREKSVALDLSKIQRSSVHSGFLYSSAKIHIYLHPGNSSSSSSSSSPTPKSATEPAFSSRMQSSNRGHGLAQVAAGSVPDTSQLHWKCTICDNVNWGVSKCTLCGVAMQEPKASAGGSRSNTHPYNKARIEKGDAAGRPIRCPVCTFDNHATMSRCEICDSVLVPAGAPGEQGDFGVKPATPQRAPSLGHESTSSDSDSSSVPLKLSFRAGGSSTFYSSLKDATSDKAWALPNISAFSGTPAQSPTAALSPLSGDRRPAIGGISTIVSAAHENERARDVTLKSAFSDLDALVAKANEIVGMAEHIATQLNSPAANKLRSRGRGSGSGGSDEDEDSIERANAFKQYLLDLGIDSPVTKDAAGSMFHEELARELSEYLENYVSQSGGTVALVDAYCLYNRAREFSLVYPEDFVQACRRFEELNLSLRLRAYPSGLLVLEDASSASDAAVISRISGYIANFGPLTANDLATIEECPLTLAEEHLWLSERAGCVCRDESVEGVRFYPNIFV